MTELSQSEYAVARGWSAAYVTKLKRQGRLVITGTGKVNVEATDRLASQCAAEPDVDRVHALLTKHVRKIAKEMAQAMPSTPTAEQEAA